MAANGLKFEEGPIDETKDEKDAREARNKDINESIELLLKSELTDYTKRTVLAKSNMASLWGIVIGQCTDSLQEQIRAKDEYETNSSNYDSIWLIKTLKKVISGVTAQSNIYHSLFHALKDFYNIRQQDNENIEAYYRLQMVGLSHGEILDSDKLIQHEAKKGKTMTPSEASDQFLATAFIENANSSRYNLLWRELTNGISMKKDLYLKTLARIN